MEEANNSVPILLLVTEGTGFSGVFFLNLFPFVAGVAFRFANLILRLCVVLVHQRHEQCPTAFRLLQQDPS